MIEDLSMKDDIQLIIHLIENNGHNLDPDTILSLTNYIERNLSTVATVKPASDSNAIIFPRKYDSKSEQ